MKKILFLFFSTLFCIVLRANSLSEIHNNSNYLVDSQFASSPALINDTISCPFAIIYGGRVPMCGNGMLAFYWDFCEDPNMNGIPPNYWAVDSAVWNMGDGQIETTYGTDSLVFHQYTVVTPVFITGNVYFTGANGEHCISPVYNYSLSLGNLALEPCTIYSENNSLPQYMEIAPYYALPNLYLQTESLCSGVSFDLFDSGNAFPTGSSNWSYSVFVDGILSTSGSGLPSQSGSFWNITLFAGDHLVELEYSYTQTPMSPIFDHESLNNCSSSAAIVISVDSCGTGNNDENCLSCNTFKPKPGERYWMSAWVKENHTTQQHTYEKAHLRLTFNGSATPNQDFYPSGEVIDGWQRIVSSFTIPLGTTDMDIKLMNSSPSIDAYFDDIRIHPFNASMKSYVYDPETLWLTAELDDNNYATFYEYDKEGQLIRIKKETARGIMTIQESRSSNPKQ